MVSMKDGVWLATDVYPDGRSMLVADGIIRTRYRNPSLLPLSL